MERQILLILTLMLIALVPGQAQEDTRPMLGVTRMPQPGDSIRPFAQITKAELERSGYRQGEKVPDFQLYTLEGERFRLQEALSQGRPMLLVGASYTCNIWRRNSDHLHRISSKYGKRLPILLVYTLESHPSGGLCPTSTEMPKANSRDSVFFEQPGTYGQRMEMARTMVEAMDIRVPVLIDDPVNSWWSHFGPAFNMAYLIGPNGIVRARQVWFMNDTEGTDLECEIDLLLGDRKTPCQVKDTTAPFLFMEDTGRNGLLKGFCGDTLRHSGRLVNQTADSLSIRVVPESGVLPLSVWSWTLDGKRMSGIDPVEIRLKPRQTVPMTIQLIPSKKPESRSLSFRFSAEGHQIQHRFRSETRERKVAKPTETLVYRKVGKQDLHLLVWKPRDWQTGDRRPALLLFHGGGWRRGQPDNLTDLAVGFSRLGFVAISAEYRLADSLGTSMRESIDDAFRAMAWVRAHADSLGIDPERIVAGGGSAGAHLAACLGSLESFRGDDGRKGTLPNALLLAAPALRLDSALMAQSSLSLTPKDYASFSPLDHLGKHHPPTLMLYGTRDHIIPANQPREYVEALEKLGVKASLEVFPDARHAFYTSPDNLEQVVRLTEDFLNGLGWNIGR